MPTTPDGMRLLVESKVAYGPAMAAKAGGVAASALEAHLSEIMTRIHEDVLSALLP